MNDTVIDNDSGCLESIHNISGVCYGEESINVDKFPKQTKRIVKNTLKYNPWLMSDYLSLNCMGRSIHQKELVANFPTISYFVYFVKNCDTRLSGSVRVLSPDITGLIRTKWHSISRNET